MSFAPVRIGVVGVGGMGGSHLKSLAQGIEGLQVTAIADVSEVYRNQAAQQYGLPAFPTAEAMMDSGLVEAVVVAVPHPFHAPIAIAAAQRGIHVMSEKPIAVTVSEADRMLQAAKEHGIVLGIMFQNRLTPAHQKIKDIVDSGVLGDILEVNMVATAWYRTQAYYNSGSWRATWKGEGGGVLANQAPHDLDLFIWIGGLPKAVKALLKTRYHRIEVEDTALALCDYGGLKTGTFVTTTSDPMGSRKLEIVGSKGRLLLDRNGLRLCRYPIPLPEHMHSAQQRMEKYEGTWEDVPVEGRGGGHPEVLRRFARAIRLGEPLVATGEDGLRALELANAIHLAGLRDKTARLPLDRAEVDALFHELRDGVRPAALAGA